MTIKFGQKQTMADKAAVAGKHKNPKGSKDSPKSGKMKLRPIIKKGTVGIKGTMKLGKRG